MGSEGNVDYELPRRCVQADQSFSSRDSISFSLSGFEEPSLNTFEQLDETGDWFWYIYSEPSTDSSCSMVIGVKICDVDLSIIVGSSHAAHSILGTPEYMEPDLFVEDSH
ncbi:hypothetical protein FNV43_RR14855 [Rhamnella rubrinervis]|uniref:Uncharacterized protein n=1 Tax=Rhamnella rubrinervis TaxID=2594499 RepID=A0A8K0MGQ4_9ROSA|nr:hypothetical protein FNV43_RR14855 [Rhamnella rubrinervis]